MPLTGRGILIHINQSVGIHHYSLQWDQIRSLSPERTLLIGGFKATEKYGKGTMVMVLAEHGEIVHITRDFTFTSDDFPRCFHVRFSPPMLFCVSFP